MQTQSSDVNSEHVHEIGLEIQEIMKWKTKLGNYPNQEPEAPVFPTEKGQNR